MKTRAGYLVWLRNEIVDKIYEKKQEAVNKAIGKLCWENSRLISGGHTFLYEGEWYTIREFDSILANKKLHRTLQKSMHELIHPANYDEFEERINIQNVVNSAVQFAKNKADLYAIFIDPIKEILNELDLNYLTIEKPKNQEEIDSFKESHYAQISALNCFFINDLFFNQEN